jgi:hypothetical protein
MYNKKYRFDMIEEFNGRNRIYDNMKGRICYPAYLKVGERGWMLYENEVDEEWIRFPHRLHTSIIQNVEYENDRIIVTTENTRFVLGVIAG